ncbi:MAG: hypothetical protein ACI814_004575 [Mariniblastus sp.]|jgi:hypothetical protein
MKNSNLFKNLLFLTLVVGGAGALSYLLMSKDQIASPSSFAPGSQAQAEIRSVAQRIDEAFEFEWEKDNLDHASRASELIVARRLSLGLAGTIPSLEEIRELESQEPKDRNHWWVSRLLEDQRTSQFIAERLARALVGVEEGPFLVFRRRRFVSWLSEEIRNNRPYDQLVHRILTNEGLWTDTPSVNFYTRTLTDEEAEGKPDPILLAGRTTRAFLGMRIDCLQCHDDFLGTINLGSAESPESGMQSDFHSLAAFFSQVDNSLLGIRDNPSREPYQYKLLDEQEPGVIPAAVPFNRNLDSGEGGLRQRLASWVTHPDNKPFARATVNRMWAIMFGRGLVDPVDDISLEGPFPEALEILADDFVQNGYDLHRLIRIIATTEAIKLESQASFEVTRQHESSHAVFPMVRLRPDQVSGGIAQSTKLTTIDSTSHIITRLTKYGQQNDFVERFGDPGEDEFIDRGETVTQRLLMLNGKMIDERIESPLNAPLHLAGLAPNAAKAVEVVYLSTLTRRPSPEEAAEMVPAIETKRGKERTAEVLDLYWTLINSAEFRWNH